MAFAYKRYGVVFHLDNELEDAEQFCKKVNEMITDKFGGDHPKVETFDSMSHPGKQTPANVDCALKTSRYFFFSEAYYEKDEMGFFAGNTAMAHGMPDRFIRLMIGATEPETNEEYPTLASFTGLQLTSEWNFTKQGTDKLKTLFASDSDREEEPCQQQEDTVGGDDLEVMNPSISSSFDTQSLASSETHLNAAMHQQGVSSNEENDLPQSDLVEDRDSAGPPDGELGSSRSSDGQNPVRIPSTSRLSEEDLAYVRDHCL